MSGAIPLHGNYIKIRSKNGKSPFLQRFWNVKIDSVYISCFCVVTNICSGYRAATVKIFIQSQMIFWKSFEEKLYSSYLRECLNGLLPVDVLENILVSCQARNACKKNLVWLQKKKQLSHRLSVSFKQLILTYYPWLNQLLKNKILT